MKKLIRTLVITLCLAIATVSLTYANNQNELLMSKTVQEQSEIFAVILVMHGIEDVCFPNECSFQGLDESGNAWWNVKCKDCKDTYRIKVKDDKDGTIEIYNRDSLGNLGDKSLKK